MLLLFQHRTIIIEGTLLIVPGLISEIRSIGVTITCSLTLPLFVIYKDIAKTSEVTVFAPDEERADQIGCTFAAASSTAGAILRLNLLHGSVYIIIYQEWI